MEKIPYKPGDQLWSEKLATKRIVLDLSQNGYVAFLDYKIGSYGNGYTKLDLDDDGFILKTPAKWWIPEQGSRYYFINSTGVVDMDYWEGVKAYSHWRFASKNVFKTKEEAEEAYNKIMNS